MEQRPIRPPVLHAEVMKPGERIAALIYLPIHIFALPLLLPLIAPYLSITSSLGMNIIYYIIGFIYVIAIFLRYLRRNFDAVLDHPLNFLISVFGAYAIEFMLSLFLTSLFSAFGLTLLSPNNEAVSGMAPEGYYKLFAISVFLAPFVEEILFRGLIFGALVEKHKVLAWIVSVLAFSLYHVWQYAVTDGPLVLVTAVLYFPASIALNWSYRRSGTIWGPIAYHMLTNCIAMAVI